MKTLDEIINNENYKRLNRALIDRSIELATKIHEAMRSAEITEIGDYSIRTVKSHSGYSDTSLYILAQTESDYETYPEYRSLEDRTSRYYCNDFNCWIEAAKGKDRLKFLNDAKSILNEIYTIKQERIANVEKALKEVESL